MPRTPCRRHKFGRHRRIKVDPNLKHPHHCGHLLEHGQALQRRRIFKGTCQGGLMQGEWKAYYGEDRSTLVEARNTPGLLASQVQLLFTVSEFDPRDFQDQAALLAQAWHQRKGRFPPLKFLAGHNHLSPAQSIGSGEDQLARRVADFIAVVSRR